VLGSAAARLDQNETARLWLTRVSLVVVCLISPALAYLALSLVHLQTALADAQHQQQQQQLVSELITVKRGSVRRARDMGKLLPPRPSDVAIIEFQQQQQGSSSVHKKKQTLVLATRLGDIRIVLRPDLSPESVEYITETVRTGCQRCNLYRAERPGVLQGRIVGAFTDAAQTVRKGPCPAGYETVPNHCPDYDASCGCHGPVMTRGLVAWAAGKTGPDFFVNDYVPTAHWWGTTHTCFGEIQDAASFAVVDEIWTLPTHKTPEGLTHLNDFLEFQIRIEEEDDDEEEDFPLEMVQ